MNNNGRMTPAQRIAAMNMIPTLLKDGPIDCYGFAIAWQKATEEHLDWHEFSYLLDWLYNLGLLKHAGFGRDGQEKYTTYPKG